MKTLLFVFALGLIAAAIAAYLMTPPPAHVLAAVDTSLSERQDCAGLRKAAETLAGQDGIREGSTLTLLSMPGGMASEPVRLFDKALPVPSDKVMGRDDAAFASERSAFFDAFEKACAGAPKSKTSPILPLVRRGLEHLRSRGCGEKHPCYLVAQTDLEDETPALSPILARAAKKPGVTLPPNLAGSLNNAGVRIQFVGTAETNPRRNKRRQPAPEELQRIWLQLFTHQELVSFQPYVGQ